jgi:ComEC/Rec2-related protein
MSFDSLCSISDFTEKNQICSLVETDFGAKSSNLGNGIARQVLTIKRLINQLKDTSKTQLILLKFRFFDLKNYLEELQAKKSLTLKLWQGEDNLRFMNGLVLGQKSPSASFLPAFTNAGLLHVLVASGFNVALVAGLAWSVVRGFSKAWQMIFTLTVIWFYVIYLEFQPPLLRAAWMFSLVFILKFLGLKTSKARILAWSVGIILVFQPDLVSSLSLWLSTLATLGILSFSQRLSLFWHEQKNQQGGYFRRLFGILLEEGRTSLAAQSLIFPLLAWFFHSINLVSFLANPLLLPWLGTITQLSGLQFLLSFLEGFWPARIIIWLLAQALSLVFAWYFAAVAWWQRLYFLNSTVSQESVKPLIVIWLLLIGGIYYFTRIKTEPKNHFFHEKA